MKKRIMGAIVLAAALGGGPALALQNVANTSQKGSLLIFPLINVDTQDSSNTLIEISNDSATSPVHLECFYVNERKGRVDFDFTLSPKATASWEVLTGSGDIPAPAFPTGGNFSPGNPRKGELVCFAINPGSTNQIAFNHLTGTATVIALADTDARQTRQAFRYNPWSFIARSASGLPALDNVLQGPAGDLQLTGGGDGTYDACPMYNIVNFVPNGATLNGVTTIDNDLSVVSCNQDLRQDFLLHLTKLQFTVWNVNEHSFSGSYICADSVTSVPLGPADRSPTLINGTNFDFAILRTDNARYMVQGVPSTQCPGPPASQTEGLLGVATASLQLGAGAGVEDQEVGSTTQGAGMLPGFVLWDPAGTVPFSKKK
jgi:hypothetical protein